jgi:hypothetical protein
MAMRARTGLKILTIAAAVAVTYVKIWRPWELTWGATPDEVSRPLPGDDLVTRPTFNATRAISIDAPPEEIWPWLVQVGSKRAGWYSYDWLDNLGRSSARRIIPELQHLAPGDIVPMSPDGTQGIQVYSLDRPNSMIWGTPGNTSWVWQLDARPDGARVITRIRSRIRWQPISIAYSVLMEIGDFWMIRKMLLNLRDRAEGRSAV